MNGMYIRLRYTYHIYLKSLVNKLAVSNGHARFQSELRRPIPRNSVESDHGCTSRIYLDNAGDNMALTLYNVTLTSQKAC